MGIDFRFLWGIVCLCLLFRLELEGLHFTCRFGFVRTLFWVVFGSSFVSCVGTCCFLVFVAVLLVCFVGFVLHRFGFLLCGFLVGLSLLKVWIVFVCV